ncbi:MAG: family 20 glycosylhydrolase [Ignavibacteriales bacterium]|nr:family 20 glycosylhydrolase [Ignavibacteriales bacterium]
MKKNINICIVALIFSLPILAQEEILTVIPQPQEFKFTEEKFLLDNPSPMIKLFCKNYEPVNIAIEELQDVFKKHVSTSSSLKSETSETIQIGIPSEDKNFKSICKSHNLFPEEILGEEGYKLLITAKTIIIAANNQKGLFYGIQTIKQMIRGTRNSFLRGVRIKDWSSLKYRVVMDDISRGPIPTVEFMKYQIRRLAEMKINFFTPYIEHVVKTKSHPEFAPVDGSLTIAQWKEISDYAFKYNIMMIGNFQSFGHFNNILSTPEYAHLGESGTMISPLLPASYKFLKDIYSEMVPVFFAPFFSINCDETFDLGKGASKKMVDSLGYAEVYYQHIIKLYNIVKNLGKQVIIWGDVLLEYPDLFKKLPKDIIIGTWTYDDLDSYAKFIDPIKEAGFKFFVTPGVLNSGRLFPNYTQSFGNIKGFVNAAVKSGAMGMINTVWDDGGNAFFSNDWYGVSYSADKSWNSQSNDSTDFDTRFNSGLYGDKENYFTKAVWKLLELSNLEPTDGMNDKILFEKLLPDSSKHLRVSLNDWDKVIAITDKAKSIMNKSNPVNYRNDKKYFLFVCDLYSTLASERFNLLKAANLYSRADSIFIHDRPEARRSILESINLISGIIKNEISLKFEFEKLWLEENHTYALDRITGGYQNKINDFTDVKTKLLESLKRLDSGLPISSSEETRLTISKLPGKYFREWLAVNPFPNRDGKPLSKIDYLAEIGGEFFIHPKVTQEFYFDSTKYRWSRIATSYQDIVNLTEMFPKNNKNVVSYVFATIEVNKDTTVKTLVGFSDGIEIFLNGGKVFSRESNGRLIPDEYYFGLPLQKGINNLMLKISQTNGEWGFTFRLADVDVRSRKNRYKIIF